MFTRLLIVAGLAMMCAGPAAAQDPELAKIRKHDIADDRVERELGEYPVDDPVGGLLVEALERVA